MLATTEIPQHGIKTGDYVDETNFNRRLTGIVPEIIDGEIKGYDSVLFPRLDIGNFGIPKAKIRTFGSVVCIAKLHPSGSVNSEPTTVFSSYEISPVKQPISNSSISAIGTLALGINGNLEKPINGLIFWHRYPLKPGVGFTQGAEFHNELAEVNNYFLSITD